MRVSGHGGTHELPEEPAAEAATSPAAASVTRGAPKEVPLTAANKKKIEAAAQHVISSGDYKKHHLSGMPLGVMLASFPVTIRPISIRSQQTTVYVPEGPLVPNPRLKHDPNQAKEYYVEIGKGGNLTPGFYGPFKIK